MFLFSSLSLPIIPLEIIYRHLFGASGSPAWMYVHPAELITLASSLCLSEIL